MLRRWFDLMMANQEDLAQLMTAEQGKPLAESRGEVAYAAVVPRMVRRGGQARLRRHHSRPSGRQAHRRHQGADRRRRLHHAVEFSARDDHAQGRARRSPPAARVVLKPASQTPFSALALAELAERAGVPKGVFNVITGAASEIGGELTSNPIVRKLSFTGSTEIGKLLMAQCAAHGEEAVARARRQRAVHRVRRCGSRCGGRRRDRVEVPQHRPDVRVREPAARAGLGVRRVRGEARGARSAKLKPAPGTRRRRDAGAADRRQGGREGREPHRRRDVEGREGAGRRQAPRARRPLLRADDPRPT